MKKNIFIISCMIHLTPKLSKGKANPTNSSIFVSFTAVWACRINYGENGVPSISEKHRHILKD